MPRINVPTIPLNDAIERVTLFREQLIDQVPEANIPRAILIPIQDLLAIVEKYTTVNEKGQTVSSLSGVRAYFAVKATDKDLPNDVTALIVPVTKTGSDIVTSPSLVNDGEDDSEIYDFTLPCPTQCDPESPLYIK